MDSLTIGSKWTRALVAAVLCGAMLLLAGCISGGGYARGQFHGYVIDRSGEDIVSKVGKPVTVEEKSPGVQHWTYHKKTFDTENQNRTDDTTTVVLERDASGKLVGKDVIYG